MALRNQLINVIHFSLKIWEEAVSYLLGCEIRFESYEEIGRSLKPFSLTVKGVSSS